MISVLYVDDEQTLLDIGKIFLERLGNFTVTLQNSAREALELLQTRSFDAIISDYQMPGMDGLEFLQEVRKNYGQIPFILFTGRGREEVVILALNGGADFYLQKGGEPQAQYTELVYKIRQAVQRRQAEKSLAESERRYRDVVETQTEFITRFTSAGIMVFINEAYCRYLGKTKEELLGKRFIPDIPPMDQDRVSAHFLELTTAHPLAEITHQIIHPDGSLRWQWWNNRGIFDENGTLLEYQSVGADITEQVTAKQYLKEQEHRLQTLGQSIPGAIYQFERLISGEFRFQYIQGSWEDLFGITPEEAILSSASTFAAIHPDDIETVYRTLNESSVSLTPWSCEFRITSHGQIKWILGRSVPELHVSDGSTLWNGVLMDITEQKNVQEALRESEEKFRVLAENAPASITVVQDNINVYVNEYASHMTGFTREEYYQNSFWSFIHPDHRDTIKERGISRLNGESVQNRHEIKYLTKDGQVRWADVSAGNIIYQGKPAFISMMVDITDRKQAEKKLQGANEELTAAHEELQAQLIELRDQQNRLSESEQDYRAILENIQDVYFRTDREGTLTLASPSMATVLGYDTVQELYGIPISTSLYLHPEQRDEILSEIDRAGSVSNYEVTMKKSDGTPVYTLISSHPYRSPDGEIAGVEGIFRDITERKKMEDAVHASENLYRSIFENTGAGTTIIAEDTTILLANASWEHLTGVALQDQQNKKFWTDFIAPDDLDRMKQYHQARRKDPASAPKVYECKIIDIRSQTHNCILYVDMVPNSSTSVASFIDITSLRKMESALSSSEEQYRNIIEQMQDPFYRTDMQGRLVMVNPAFVTEFGYQSSQELLGKTIADAVYLHPDERDGLIHQLNENGEVKEYRISLKRDADHIFTFTASSHLIYDADRNPVGVEGILHDITDHLRVEKAFVEMEIKYHELSELLPQMVFEMNAEFRITYANQYTRDALGYTSQDIEGMEFFACVDPSQHVGLRHEIENFWQDPTSGIHEFTAIKKDGTRIPVLIYTAPVYRDQEIFGYCGVIIDISERKQMDQTLQESEELLRAVFSNASDEILVHEISPDTGPGAFILVNDISGERLGYSRKELMGLSLPDILPQGSTTLMYQVTDLLFTKGNAVFESVHLRKDKTIYPVEVNSRLFHYGSKTVALSICRDISGRKRDEGALRQMNHKLNILSSITRHDLVNQLNALILFLDLSKNLVKDNPQSLEYLEKELEITRIMSDQIGFTKSYQDIGVEKPEWTQVERLILFAADQLEIRADMLDVSLSGLEIYADPLVEKVFYNLLENSLRHGVHVSQITITSYQVNEDLVIRYADNGVGVVEEYKDLIFTKGFGSNSGWGMFLSREILSITQSTIRETGIPGEGARFEITVPQGTWRITDRPG